VEFIDATVAETRGFVQGIDEKIRFHKANRDGKQLRLGKIANSQKSLSYLFILNWHEGLGWRELLSATLRWTAEAESKE
jgi:hypothetical protein